MTAPPHETYAAPAHGRAKPDLCYALPRCRAIVLPHSEIAFASDDHDAAMPFPELNRVARGHYFYPTESIPDLYATEDTPLDDKIVHAHYYVIGGTGDWFLMELEKGDPTRMLTFGYAEVIPGGGEFGYTDLIALESLLIRHENAPPTLVERDLSWTPRPWSQVRRERDAKRRTIVLTDRAVATEEGAFDPASIARFVVEHSRGAQARVYLVVDAMDARTLPLREFARANGFIVWTVSTTRRARTWSDEIERVIAREPEGSVVVCDPYYDATDARVSVKRRITR